MFLKIGRELVKPPWLFYYPMFQKRTAQPGENSCKHIYFIDGKHCMGNFHTPSVHRFLRVGKSYMHKKTTVKSLSDKNNK